jgi:hypothetical protein
MAKQIISIVFLITGAALLIGLSLFALDNATSAEPEGLGTWISTVLGMLLSASTGISAWINLRKTKDETASKIELRDNSKYFEKVEHYHEAPEIKPEVHDTIGFIPPDKTVTYVHRGKIEEDVIAYLKEGKSGAIVGVHAPGGLGKTELAKQAAENLKDSFEILWVDVGEKKPQAVAGELLIKCGVQTQPADTYERMINELRHAYQSHRFLIILDDVRKDALERIGDFLPPSRSAALVTSRIQQIGGVTRSFPLDSMTWEQAQDLFGAILGSAVVENERDAVRTLAERCKFNPLAMEIAARRIRQLEGNKRPVAKYFEIAQTKFSELKMEGDARWDMETIFDISYLDLSADDREKFIALSAFHPTGFSMDAVSHLWGTESSASRRILFRFINLSLVKNVEADGERYRLHDLLDEYASSKLKTSGGEMQTKTALAQWLVELFEKNYVPGLENFSLGLPERDNLLYACAWARGEKQADLLALLTTNSRNWFYVYFTDAWVSWYAWLESCLQLGLKDKRLEANVLQAIGDVQQFRKENDAALESYNAALKLFQAVGARLGEANTLQSLGKMMLINANDQPSLEKAMETIQASMNLYEEIKDLVGQVNILMFLSRVAASMSQKEKALEIAQEALPMLVQVAGKTHPVTLSFEQYIEKLKQGE